jgi:hypothetical protein
LYNFGEQTEPSNIFYGAGLGKPGAGYVPDAPSDISTNTPITDLQLQIALSEAQVQVEGAHEELFDSSSEVNN